MPKTHFVMLMQDEKLARLQTRFDAESGVLDCKNAAPAWNEHDWIDREIEFGAARLRVISPITGCAATQVNPVTAERDLDIVAAIGRAFGHTDMGANGEVVGRGEIAVDDRLLRSASGT